MILLGLEVESFSSSCVLEVVSRLIHVVPAAFVLIRRIRAASEMPLTVGAIVSTRAVGMMGDEERGDLGDLDLLEDEEGRRL